MDNGPELVSQALQRFCDGKVGLSYIPPGCPWDNGYIESFNNRLRKECLNRNHWNTLFEARVVIGDFKHEHNHRHRHSALGYRTPAEYAAACRHTHTPGGLRHQLNPEQTNPTLNPGGLSNGDSPPRLGHG
jgi:putative transposase